MVIEGRKLMILLVASFMTATSISGIAVAQNVSSQNMTGRYWKYKFPEHDRYRNCSTVENLTGNNTQFNNSALANLTTVIPEKLGNLTSNLTAAIPEKLANLTAAIPEKLSNISGSLTGNQT